MDEETKAIVAIYAKDENSQKEISENYELLNNLSALCAKAHFVNFERIFGTSTAALNKEEKLDCYKKMVFLLAVKCSIMDISRMEKK